MAQHPSPEAIRSLDYSRQQAATERIRGGVGWADMKRESWYGAMVDLGSYPEANTRREGIAHLLAVRLRNSAGLRSLHCCWSEGFPSPSAQGSVAGVDARKIDTSVSTRGQVAVFYLTEWLLYV